MKASGQNKVVFDTIIQLRASLTDESAAKPRQLAIGPTIMSCNCQSAAAQLTSYKIVRYKMHMNNNSIPQQPFCTTLYYMGTLQCSKGFWCVQCTFIHAWHSVWYSVCCRDLSAAKAQAITSSTTIFVLHDHAPSHLQTLPAAECIPIFDENDCSQQGYALTQNPSCTQRLGVM